MRISDLILGHCYYDPSLTVSCLPLTFVGFHGSLPEFWEIAAPLDEEGAPVLDGDEFVIDYRFLTAAEVARLRPCDCTPYSLSELVDLSASFDIGGHNHGY